MFNNWAVFYQGKFETVNLLDLEALKRILKKRKIAFASPIYDSHAV